MFTLDEVKRIAEIQSEVQNFSEKVRNYISDNLDDLLILLDPGVYCEGIIEGEIYFYENHVTCYDIDDYGREIKFPYQLLMLDPSELKQKAQEAKDKIAEAKKASATSYQKYIEEQDYQRYLELKAKFEPNPGDII